MIHHHGIYQCFRMLQTMRGSLRIFVLTSLSMCIIWLDWYVMWLIDTCVYVQHAFCVYYTNTQTQFHNVMAYDFACNGSCLGLNVCHAGFLCGCCLYFWCYGFFLVCNCTHIHMYGLYTFHSQSTVLAFDALSLKGMNICAMSRSV